MSGGAVERSSISRIQMAKSRDSSAARNAPDLLALSQDFKSLQASAATLFPELARAGTEFRSAKEACQALLGYARTVVGKLAEVKELTEGKELGAAYMRVQARQEEMSGKLGQAKDTVVALSKENESLLRQLAQAKRQCEELLRAHSPSDPSLTMDAVLHDRDKEILKLRSKVRNLTSKVSTANEDYWRSKADKYKIQLRSLQAEPLLQLCKDSDYLDLLQVQAKALETTLQPPARDLHAEEKIVRLGAQLADMTEGESQLQQLIQQLDQQNKDLYASLTTKERETAFLQDQIKRLQRESTPKKTPKQVYLTPKKRAAYERINELMAAGDLPQAAQEWREADYFPVQGETVERNFDMLREVVHLRDKEVAALLGQVRTKEVDLKLATQRLETELQVKDGEMDLLKGSLGAVESREPGEDLLKQRIAHMEETLKGKDGHIAILVEQCESLSGQVAGLRSQNESLESRLRSPFVSHSLEQALVAKDRETELLIRQSAEAKGQAEALKAQVVKLEDQLIAAKSSASQTAYITRLETELKVLRAQGGETGEGLRELIQRVVSRSERTMEGMEKEIRDLQNQVEIKVAERVGKQLEAVGEWTAQEAQLRAYVDRLEREAQLQQSTFESLQLENNRLQSLFEEERRAHAATLKLLQAGNPSLMELEQQREDYLSNVQASLSTQIRKLSDRIDVLQREIVQKNSEVKDLECKYSRDTADLADKLKDEHTRKLEIAALFKDSKAEADKYKDEALKLRTALDRREQEVAKAQGAKVREAEDAVLHQNTRISDLESLLKSKDESLSHCKDQQVLLKRQLEDAERSIALLRNQVQDLTDPDLRRFEADNMRLRSEIEKMRRGSGQDLSEALLVKEKELQAARGLMEKYRSQLEIRSTGKSAEAQAFNALLEEKAHYSKQQNAQFETLSADLRKARDDRSKALEEAGKLQRLALSLPEWVEVELPGWQALGFRGRSRRSEDLAEKVNWTRQTLAGIVEEWKQAQQFGSEEVRLEASRQTKEVLTDSTSSAAAMAQLVSSNLQLEKELLGKSQSVLRDDGLLKTLLASKGTGSEMAGRLALQRWQEAEQEVYKLRARLVETTGRLEKAYVEDRREDLGTLRRKLEEGTAQIGALQSTVQNLQEGGKESGEVLRLRTELSKAIAASKALEDTANKAQAEARKSSHLTLRLQEELQRKEDTIRAAVEKLFSQIRQMPRASDSLVMAADPVKALEQIGAQLWTWMRLVQIELEKKGRQGDDEGRRWESQEAEYQRRVAGLETERTALLSRCELLKSELRTAKADLEVAKTPEPRRKDSRSYDVDLYERGRLVGINEGRKEKEEQFESERQRLQQVAKRYSGSLEDLQRQFQTLQDKYIALMKEPKVTRLDQTDELQQLRREKEDLQAQQLEWKDTLKRKEEEVQRLRAQVERPVAPPIRSASPARHEDAIKLDLLNRRSAALKEIQECERSNRVVDPAMRIYVRELNAALTKYP